MKAHSSSTRTWWRQDGVGGAGYGGGAVSTDASAPAVVQPKGQAARDAGARRQAAGQGEGGSPRPSFSQPGSATDSPPHPLAGLQGSRAAARSGWAPGRRAGPARDATCRPPACAHLAPRPRRRAARAPCGRRSSRSPAGTEGRPGRGGRRASAAERARPAAAPAALPLHLPALERVVHAAHLDGCEWEGLLCPCQVSIVDDLGAGGWVRGGGWGGAVGVSRSALAGGAPACSTHSPPCLALARQHPPPRRR